MEVRNLPVDFPDKELASKMVIYSKNKNIKRSMPELNKDFYESLGISTDNEKYLRSVKTHMKFELSDKLYQKNGIVAK